MSIESAEAGFSLLRLVWRPMSPVLDFGQPRQDTPRESPKKSWYSVPISIRDAGVLHKTNLPRAQVWAVRYLRNTQVGEGIKLRWNTRDGPMYEMSLELGRIYPVPLAVRDESNGLIVIMSDDVYQEKLKWRLTPDGFFRWDELIHGPQEVNNIEWKIEVHKPAKMPWVSPHSYVVSVPSIDASNDTFRVTVNAGK